MAIQKIQGAQQQSAISKIVGTADSGISKVNGSAVWAPTDLTGLAMWLKNGVGITSDGGTPDLVSQWDDSSGNNNHAVQATAGLQGVVSGGGIDLDGTDNFYSLSSQVTMSGDHNIVVGVVFLIDSDDHNMALLSSASNEFLELQSRKILRINCTGTATNLTDASNIYDAASGKQLLLVTRLDDDTGTWVFYRNGAVLEGTWNNETNAGAIDFTAIGVRAGSGDRYFDGKIYEMVVYDLGTGTMDAAGVTNLNSYLKMVHSIGD